MRDFYVTALEARVVFENSDGCFLTYDDEHHRLAIMKDDRLADIPPGYLRKLDHVAFRYPDLDALLTNHERLRVLGLTPYWTVNHGPTTSFYYRDPDRNGVELQVDNYATVEELHSFFRSPHFERNPIGVDVDPDELRRRLNSGESVRAVLTRPDTLASY